MPYPNTVLAAWQLTVIALVAVGTLTVWLVAVFIAARPSHRAGPAAPALPGESPAARTAQPAAAAGPGPAQPAERPAAA